MDVVEDDVLESVFDAMEKKSSDDSTVAPEESEAPTIQTFDFDEEFQGRVAALILRDEIFLKRCAHLLSPDYFDSYSDKLIAKLALEHHDRFKASLQDPAAMKQVLADAIRRRKIRDEDKSTVIKRVKQLYRTPVDNPEFTAEVVSDFARTQAVDNAMMKCLELRERGELDKMREVMEKAFAVGQRANGSVYDYFAENDNRADTREKIAKGMIKRKGLPIGVPQFDNLLHHRGFGYSELTVFMAGAKRGKCVTRDTLILTEDGMMNIGDYVDESVRVDCFKPKKIRILGRDGMECTSHVYNSGLTDTLKIKTNKGYEIEGTHHHPMLVIQDGKYVWKNLEELTTDDAIVVQHGRKVFGNHSDISYASDFAESEDYYRKKSLKVVTLPKVMTPELAEFIGLITAEAYCSGENDVVNFTQKDPIILRRYQFLIDKLFGLNSSVTECKGKTPCVRFQSVTIGRYLRNLGVSFCHSRDKEIPKSIRMAPEPCVRAFLNVVLGVEGNVQRKNTDSASYDLTMASEKMIHQIHVMLTNYGIVAKRSVKSSMATNGLRIKRDYHRIQIRNTEEICILRDEIGLYEERKHNLLIGLEPQLRTKRDEIPNTKPIVRLLVEEMRDFGFVFAHDVGVEEWRLVRAALNGSRASSRNLTRYHIQCILSALEKRTAFKSEHADRLRELINCNYHYERVVEITKSQAETVDFTVPKTHSFFANGLVSHNTTAIWDIAKRWSMKGHNVLGITLEVSTGILSDRIDANVSDVKMSELEKYYSDVQARIKSAAAKAGKLLIHEYPSNSLRPADVEQLIEDYRSQGIFFDAVVVDYLDIMAPNKWMPNAIENSKNIWSDMRGVAQKFGVVMLSATQLNREGTKKTTADDTDVAEDYNKIRIADLVLSINATDEELAKGESRIFFAASRNQRGKFTVLIKNNMESMQFMKAVLEVS